jgi:hypothetical protein
MAINNIVMANGCVKNNGNVMWRNSNIRRNGVKIMKIANNNG